MQRLIALTILISLSAGCGGGGRGSDASAVIVTAIDPIEFAAGTPTAFRISGSGFTSDGQEVGSSVVIRFTTAADGAFGGSSSSIDVTGRVVADDEVTGTSPVASVGRLVGARVSVVLSSGRLGTSSDEIASFRPPSVTGVSSPMVRSEFPHALTITGSGFGPPSTSVSVTLIASSDAPLLGGSTSSLTVTGTVNGPTELTCTTPIFGVCSPGAVPVLIRVTLPGGAVGESASPLLSVQPPRLTAASPPAIPSNTPTFIQFTCVDMPNLSMPAGDHAA